MSKQEVTVELAGGKRLVFETGRMAKQASGAALVTTGETVVLATAVASPDPREGIDFFPLTVDYREYTYAGGRIPGGFIKREGRPSEKEVLTAGRSIDPFVRCSPTDSATRRRSLRWSSRRTRKTIPMWSASMQQLRHWLSVTFRSAPRLAQFALVALMGSS